MLASFKVRNGWKANIESDGSKCKLVRMPMDLLFVPFLMALILVSYAYGKRATVRRERRLVELDAGAPEAYFEERRSLEAYPAFSEGWGWRALAGVAIMTIVARLVAYLV